MAPQMPAQQVPMQPTPVMQQQQPMGMPMQQQQPMMPQQGVGQQAMPQQNFQQPAQQPATGQGGSANASGGADAGTGGTGSAGGRKAPPKTTKTAWTGSLIAGVATPVGLALGGIAVYFLF